MERSIKDSIQLYHLWVDTQFCFSIQLYFENFENCQRDATVRARLHPKDVE